MVGALQLFRHAALYGCTGRCRYYSLCECVSYRFPLPPPCPLQKLARECENCRNPSLAGRGSTIHCSDDRPGIPGTFLSAAWYCYSTIGSFTRLHFHGVVNCHWPADFLCSTLCESQAGYQPG